MRSSWWHSAIAALTLSLLCGAAAAQPAPAPTPEPPPPEARSEAPAPAPAPAVPEVEAEAAAEAEARAERAESEAESRAELDALRAELRRLEADAAESGERASMLRRLRAELERIELSQQELERVMAETRQALERLPEETERAERVRERALERAERALERERERVRRRRSDDQRFAIGSTIKVDADEIVADAVSIGGSVKIDGEVTGGAVAVGGPVKVNGRVGRDVVAVGNRVELGPAAVVDGNVTSVGGQVLREAGSHVGGDISEIRLGDGLDFDFGDWDWLSEGPRVRRWVLENAWWDFFWSLIGLAFLTLLCCVVQLVMPQALGRMSSVAMTEPWKALLVGLAIMLLSLPALLTLCLVLVLSLIGIPLLLLVPFLVLFLIAMAVVGYAAVARGVGELMRSRSRVPVGTSFVAVAVGVFAIQIVALFAEFLDLIGLPFFIHVLFGLLGFVVQFLAWTAGLGAVALSRFGRRVPPV